MSLRLRSGQYELDLDDLYARMWAIGLDDRGDGTRLYRPSAGQSLKWLIAELSGAPAVKSQTKPANSDLRQQAKEMLVRNGWAEQFNDRGFRLLRPPGIDGFRWPTIEWVKQPIDLSSGLTNGSAIRMRHFLDCTHWYREPDGSMRGDAPRLATETEMQRLPPCGTCSTRAKSAGHDAVGPRLATESTPDIGPAEGVLSSVTDGTSVVAIRREQQYLRRHLLRVSGEAICTLCGRALPTSLLVAAHIVPRHLLNDAERLDFASAAMLACSLGCDALFENGYIAVDESGHIVQLKRCETDAVESIVLELIGRSVDDHGPATASRFAQHQALHRGT